MEIQQVVVMYLHDNQINRPPAPPIVSPCQGIMSCFSFMFLGVPRHYERRLFRCWCTVCSCVCGLTFEEWDPSADTDASEAPVAMIVNSSELRAAGFDLREVLPLQLEETARGVRCTRDTVLKQIHDMGTRRYVLSVDNDNEFRSRCE